MSRKAKTLAVELGMTFIVLSPAFAGIADSVMAPAMCTLTLQTGSDTAWVFIDSRPSGTTPLTVDTLRPGRHVLRFAQKDLRSWFTDVIADTVELLPGEKRTLRYAFERRVLVVTDPSGALIYVGDSLSGSTPMLLVSPAGRLPSSVTAEMKGFEKTVIPLPAGESGVARALLQKIWQSEPPADPFLSESGNFSRTGPELYIAGGATILAGTGAAYFKIKADARNALYQTTGAPSLRNQTRALDIAAAISLVVTEIGMACFTYYLFVD